MNIEVAGLVVLCAPLLAFGDMPLREQVALEPTRFILKATFDILKPEAAEAVLVVLPGVNGDGGKYLEERAWTRFAAERNWALVGATFVSPENLLKCNCGYYDVAEESGAMLLEALRRVGLQGKTVYLYGFSGGARFAARFADSYPGMVGGFAALGLGEIPEPTLKGGPCGVVICGADDPRVGASLTWFKHARSKDWRLAWVEVPGLGHVRSATVEEFVRQWFCDRARRKIGGRGDVWCEIGSGEVVNPVSGPASNMSWFPTERVCRLWHSSFYGLKTKVLRAEAAPQEERGKKMSEPVSHDVFRKTFYTKADASPEMTLYGRLPGRVPARGVICLSLIANDVGDIELLLKGESREGVVGEWLRYAERKGLAVLAWGAPRGLWNPQGNWDEVKRKENKSLDRSFQSVATAWKSAVNSLTREKGLPSGRYLMIGFSRAAQFAQRLAIHLPSQFSAIAVHVPSSFEYPSSAARGIVWCLTTGENESGYSRSIKFVEAARGNGYPVIYKAYPGLGHSDSPLACELGQAVFDYVLGCGDSDPTANMKSWPIVADFINQRTSPRTERSEIPVSFSILLPDSKVELAWKKD